MRFPLPSGHVFGLNPNSVQYHDGSDLGADTFYLTHWQSHYQRKWDREGVITGRFDGPTQRAALAVQKAGGLPLTGVVDAETWDAVFQPSRPGPAAVVELAEFVSQRGSEGAGRKAAARETKRTKTLPNGRTAPTWYPGSRFGAGSTGEHVKRIRIILGMAVTDVFDDDLVARVRGVQLDAKLRRTGIVDERTALAIDALAAAA
jgi:peptidoglycan hydrolase-like protein with peptidoglycan-binding domain